MLFVATFLISQDQAPVKKVWACDQDLGDRKILQSKSTGL